jgi:ubiquinone/menaquinone biosynthesis C-methylase UbiE
MTWLNFRLTYNKAMDEQTIKLLTDLHIHNKRQGPGSDGAFNLALSLSGIDVEADVQIADIGCGTGSATLPLLRDTKAHVTAVDFLPAFLDELKKQAETEGLTGRLTVLAEDMANLPFTDNQFDAIWSEGAIYNIGFKTGVEEWKRFLKPNGVLVASEITWLTADTPKELKEHWNQEYPEVATASEKMQILEEAGYTPIGYFPLDTKCWLEEYYNPIEASLDDFLSHNGNTAEAQEIAEAERKEIKLYKKYKDYVSYGMYIAKV